MSDAEFKEYKDYQAKLPKADVPSVVEQRNVAEIRTAWQEVLSKYGIWNQPSSNDIPETSPRYQWLTLAKAPTDALQDLKVWGTVGDWRQGATSLMLQYRLTENMLRNMTDEEFATYQKGIQAPMYEASMMGGRSSNTGATSGAFIGGQWVDKGSVPGSGVPASNSTDVGEGTDVFLYGTKIATTPPPGPAGGVVKDAQGNIIGRTGLEYIVQNEQTEAAAKMFGYGGAWDTGKKLSGEEVSAILNGTAPVDSDKQAGGKQPGELLDLLRGNTKQEYEDGVPIYVKAVYNLETGKTDWVENTIGEGIPKAGIRMNVTSEANDNNFLIVDKSLLANPNDALADHWISGSELADAIASGKVGNPEVIKENKRMKLQAELDNKKVVTDFDKKLKEYGDQFKVWLQDTTKPEPVPPVRPSEWWTQWLSQRSEVKQDGKVDLDKLVVVSETFYEELARNKGDVARVDFNKVFGTKPAEATGDQVTRLKYVDMDGKEIKGGSFEIKGTYTEVPGLSVSGEKTRFTTTVDAVGNVVQITVENLSSDGKVIGKGRTYDATSKQGQEVVNYVNEAIKKETVSAVTYVPEPVVAVVAETKKYDIPATFEENRVDWPGAPSGKLRMSVEVKSDKIVVVTYGADGVTEAFRTDYGLDTKANNMGFKLLVGALGDKDAAVQLVKSTKESLTPLAPPVASPTMPNTVTSENVTPRGSGTYQEYKPASDLTANPDDPPITTAQQILKGIKDHKGAIIQVSSLDCPNCELQLGVAADTVKYMGIGNPGYVYYDVLGGSDVFNELVEALSDPNNPYYDPTFALQLKTAWESTPRTFYIVDGKYKNMETSAHMTGSLKYWLADQQGIPKIGDVSYTEMASRPVMTVKRTGIDPRLYAGSVDYSSSAKNKTNIIPSNIIQVDRIGESISEMPVAPTLDPTTTFSLKGDYAQKGKLVIVKFTQERSLCRYCGEQNDATDVLLKDVTGYQNPNFAILELDVNQNNYANSLYFKAGSPGTPTNLVFYEGKLVGKVEGALDVAMFKGILESSPTKIEHSKNDGSVAGQPIDATPPSSDTAPKSVAPPPAPAITNRIATDNVSADTLDLSLKGTPFSKILIPQGAEYVGAGWAEIAGIKMPTQIGIKYNGDNYVIGPYLTATRGIQVCSGGNCHPGYATPAAVLDAIMSGSLKPKDGKQQDFGHYNIVDTTSPSYVPPTVSENVTVAPKIDVIDGIRLLKPRAGIPKNEWDVLAPEKILSQHDISLAKQTMEYRDGSWRFAANSSLPVVINNKATEIASMIGTSPKTLVESIVNNEIFNNVILYNKGIRAPNPQLDSTDRPLDPLTNSEDTWRYMYQKYNIPKEVQQKLYDNAVMIELGGVPEDDGAIVTKGYSGFKFGLGLLSDIDSTASVLGHELGHWYWKNYLTVDQKRQVIDYIESTPGVVGLLASAGKFGDNPKSNMGRLSQELFASVWLPEVNSYEIYGDDREEVIKGLSGVVPNFIAAKDIRKPQIVKYTPVTLARVDKEASSLYAQHETSKVTTSPQALPSGEVPSPTSAAWIKVTDGIITARNKLQTVDFVIYPNGLYDAYKVGANPASTKILKPEDRLCSQGTCKDFRKDEADAIKKEVQQAGLWAKTPVVNVPAPLPKPPEEVVTDNVSLKPPVTDLYTLRNIPAVATPEMIITDMDNLSKLPGVDINWSSAVKNLVGYYTKDGVVDYGKVLKAVNKLNIPKVPPVAPKVDLTTTTIAKIDPIQTLPVKKMSPAELVKAASDTWKPKVDAVKEAIKNKTATPDDMAFYAEIKRHTGDDGKVNYLGLGIVHNSYLQSIESMGAAEIIKDVWPQFKDWGISARPSFIVDTEAAARDLKAKFASAVELLSTTKPGDYVDLKNRLGLALPGERATVHPKGWVGDLSIGQVQLLSLAADYRDSTATYPTGDPLAGQHKIDFSSMIARLNIISKQTEESIKAGEQYARYRTEIGAPQPFTPTVSQKDLIAQRTDLVVKQVLPSYDKVEAAIKDPKLPAPSEKDLYYHGLIKTYKKTTTGELNTNAVYEQVQGSKFPFIKATAPLDITEIPDVNVVTPLASSPAPYAPPLLTVTQLLTGDYPGGHGEPVFGKQQMWPTDDKTLDFSKQKMWPADEIPKDNVLAIPDVKVIPDDRFVMRTLEPKPGVPKGDQWDVMSPTLPFTLLQTYEPSPAKMDAFQRQLDYVTEQVKQGKIVLPYGAVFVGYDEYGEPQFTTQEELASMPTEARGILTTEGITSLQEIIERIKVAASIKMATGISPANMYPLTEQEPTPGTLADVEKKLPEFASVAQLKTLEEANKASIEAQKRAAYIAANPAEAGKNFLIGMIPVVGTTTFWNKMKPWEQGLSVATDILTLIPFLGLASAEVRGGAAIERALGRALLSEVKAPFTAIAHPIETFKTAVMPIETLIRTDKVPLTALEIRTTTVRLPIADVGDAKTTMAARDILVDRAIKGDKPSIVIGGKQIELSQTALNQGIKPVAVHSTPDVRPFINGTVVKGSREGGLYIAPTLHTRFTRASAFGDMPNEGMRGAVLIRDENILSKLQPSGKTYRRTAEMEKVIPDDVSLPPASQILMTRDVANKPLALVVIGEPFTRAEIAKMKFVGATDLLSDIFRPAITVSGKASKYDDLVNMGREAKQLEQEIADAKIANVDRTAVKKMESELAAINTESRVRALAIDREYAAVGSLRPLGLNVGRFIDSISYNDIARDNPVELAYALSSVNEDEREYTLDEISPRYRDNIRTMVGEILGRKRIIPVEVINRVTISGTRDSGISERIVVPPPRITTSPPLRVPPPRVPIERVPSRVPPVRPPDVPVRPPDYPPRPPVPPRVPPRLGLPDIPPKIPPDKPAEKFKRLTVKQIEGAIAWKQGFIYVLWHAPYGQEDVIYSRKPLPEVKYFKGPGSAAASIIARQGSIPPHVKRDMGAFDIDVFGGKNMANTYMGDYNTKPIIKFKPDRKGKTKYSGIVTSK
jgi:hypothetical protein